MIKKTLRVFILFLFVQVILFSCGNRKEQDITLTNFFLENIDTTYDELPTVTSNNFRLYLRTNFNIVQSWKKELILNSAYAIDPIDPINVVKNKITSINITADTEIAEIAAGESLNSLFVYQEFLESVDLFDMDSFVNNINDGFENDFFFSFIFPETIPAETVATFTVVITLTDETQITQTSDAITFE